MNGHVVLFLIGAAWLIAVVGVLIFNYAAGKQNEILDIESDAYSDWLRNDASRRSMAFGQDDPATSRRQRELLARRTEAAREIRRPDSSRAASRERRSTCHPDGDG